MQVLTNKYGLTEDEITSALTFWGTNQITPDRDTSQLVRWTSNPLAVSLVIAPGVKNDVIEFARSMNTVARAIGRSAQYCTQEIEIASSGSYTPSIELQDCQRKPHDMIVVVYSSTEVPTDLFRDLERSAGNPTERRLWNTLRTDSGDIQTKTACDDVFAIDPQESAIVEATGYLRVGSDDPDGARLRRCLDALPYMLLGQRPIRLSSTHEVFALELLQLTYSSALRVGMTFHDIENALEN
jgi:hypothetical protein